MIKSWIFIQKMHCKNLYRDCIIKFLLTCSSSFSHTQNEIPIWQCHFPSYWKCLEDFSVLLYEFLYTYCVQFSTVHLLKKYQYFAIPSSRDMWKTKKSSKHFQYDGKWHCHIGSSFWVWEKLLQQVNRNLIIQSL